MYLMVLCLKRARDSYKEAYRVAAEYNVLYGLCYNTFVPWCTIFFRPWCNGGSRSSLSIHSSLCFISYNYCIYFFSDHLRGVVQLFNAVRKHQHNLEEKIKEVGGSERKKAKVISSVSKKDFIDILRGTAGAVIPTTKKEKSIVSVLFHYVSLRSGASE